MFRSDSGIWRFRDIEISALGIVLSVSEIARSIHRHRNKNQTKRRKKRRECEKEWRGRAKRYSRRLGQKFGSLGKGRKLEGVRTFIFVISEGRSISIGDWWVKDEKEQGLSLILRGVKKVRSYIRAAISNNFYLLDRRVPIPHTTTAISNLALILHRDSLLSLPQISTSNTKYKSPSLPPFSLILFYSFLLSFTLSILPF